MIPQNLNKKIPATHDLLGGSVHPLDFFFAPQTVAVIGATETEGRVGRAVFQNLISGSFGGTVFPVNLKRLKVLGEKAYPHIYAVPEKVDLAIVATPAKTVPRVIEECVEAGVKGAIIISAGFKETGKKGLQLEEEIFRRAQKGGLRIIGPNCLGVMRPSNGFNATFSRTMARPGNVAFISQSGALCTAILDWSLRELVGFSAFISIGSMLDVGWGDLIDYLADDPHTQSIVVYMESIGDARSFLSAAREVALVKPVIVIKVGRTEAGARAAASHTGAMTGSDDVLDAAFKRCGVLRVGSIEELFNMAEVLARQPRPQGPRLMILSNAGGPAVLATDALLSTGGEIAQLSEDTLTLLDQLLPPHWSHNNPIDLLGDATADRYIKAIEIVARDPNGDGLLAILAPQSLTDPTETARRLTLFGRLEGKPILASWMGGSDVEAGEAILNQANIPTFPYPDGAARVFNYMWQYSDNLKGLYETPVLAGDSDEMPVARDQAEKIIQGALRRGRSLLSEAESMKVLAAYKIPVVQTVVARSEEDAVGTAGEVGFPVVLKLYSKTITHKSDVGGVQLDLTTRSAVRKAYRSIKESVRKKAGARHFLGVTVQPMIREEGYELILGSSIDPQFGPILLFGTGGSLVEVFKDRSIGLPPLNSVLARRMMGQTKIYAALKGVRGRKPVYLPDLEQILVRFSRLVAELRWIKEIDINPFFVSDHRLVALDARMILHEPDLREDQLPKPAIRPYPAQYLRPATMKDGNRVLIRPIRPEDEPLIVKFHESLSDQSVYFRYFQSMKLSDRIAHERLIRICFIDYDREMILVAEIKEPESGDRKIIGASRISRYHGRPEAEFSVLISDPFQGKGLGSELLKRLLQIGRDEGIKKITGDILYENVVMQRICEKLGFRLQPIKGVHLFRAEIQL